MPKLGAEPIRKAALINAAISTIGQTGSLDVTVAQIARRAGMSTALAHYYFGSKEQLLIAAMRHILTEFGQSVREETRGAVSARARVDGIIRASFGPANFDRDTVAAWLSFYVLSQVNADAARLLNVYRRRLRSNLVVSLRRLTDRPEAVSSTLAALIDGVYLRTALSPVSDAPDSQAAEAAAATRLCTDYLDGVLT